MLFATKKWADDTTKRLEGVEFRKNLWWKLRTRNRTDYENLEFIVKKFEADHSMASESAIKKLLKNMASRGKKFFLLRKLKNIFIFWKWILNVYFLSRCVFWLAGSLAKRKDSDLRSFFNEREACKGKKITFDMKYEMSYRDGCTDRLISQWFEQHIDIDIAIWCAYVTIWQSDDHIKEITN